MVPRTCGSAHWNRKKRDACNTLPLNFIAVTDPPSLPTDA